MKLADLVSAGGYVVATGRTIGALPLCRYTAQGAGGPAVRTPLPAPDPTVQRLAPLGAGTSLAFGRRRAYVD